MKKYIMFDHDGVLVETEYWYYMANKRALASLGIDLQRDVYMANMADGVSSWEIARAAGIPEPEIKHSRELRNRYYQAYLSTEDIEIEGVLSTLAKLSNTYRMGIVTTSKPEDFSLIHNTRRILEYIEFYLTRESYEHAKPHPEPYLAGLKRFGASASETVVVEDSARGLRSAVAAGIDCIVVANQFTRGQDLSAATTKVNAFTDLPSAIEGLTNHRSRQP
jgi:HAD superfamily hydrolase (TIGR01509 family)